MLKRNWRWLLGGTFVLIGIAVAGCFAHRESIREEGREELAVVIAEIEATDPEWEWEWEEIQASIPPVPADRNTAELVSKFESGEIRKTVPGWEKWGDFEARIAEWPTNHSAPEIWVCECEDAFSGIGAVVELCREVVRRGRCWKPIELPALAWELDLSHTQGNRQVASLLSHQAILATEYGQPGVALDLADDILTVAESIGDEPSVISQLARGSIRQVGIQSLERTLAQGDFSQTEQRLLVLIERLTAFSGHQGTLAGLRGERAMIHRLFQNHDSGKIDLWEQIGGNDSFNAMVNGYLARPYVHLNHAAALRHIGFYIEAVQLPPGQERQELLGRVPPRPDDARDVLGWFLAGSIASVYESHLGQQAALACARVGLACEVFRMRQGRWPNALDEIPRDTLPDIPADPFTGDPLTLRRLDDGIAVHAVDATREGRDPAFDFHEKHFRGFRLWDVEQRGLAPDPYWDYGKPDDVDIFALMRDLNDESEFTELTEE